MTEIVEKIKNVEAKLEIYEKEYFDTPVSKEVIRSELRAVIAAKQADLTVLRQRQASVGSAPAGAGGASGVQGGLLSGGPFVMKDCSREVIEQIGRPFDDDVLMSITKLTSALRSELLVKIPICDSHSQVEGTCLCDTSVFLNNTEGRNTDFLCNLVCTLDLIANRFRSEETLLSSCSTTITGLFWEELGAYLESPLIIEVNFNQTGALTGDDRSPDETVYINNFLVAKGEHKASSDRIEDAVSELTSKLNDYNVIEYGSMIRYLPAYAAAGKVIEFCLVDVCTRTVVQGSRYRFNMTNPPHRVRAFVASVNYFRLIRTMAPYVSELTTATPLFKTISGITFFKGYVRKECSDRALTAPLALYRLLQAGEVPSAVTVELSEDDGESLKIQPVGVPIHSDGGLELSYDEMKDAVRCVLRCLEYLHSKGFVHRDIRWKNIIRHYTFDSEGRISSCTYLVIDFEFAAHDGDAMLIYDYIFESLVPFGAPYKAYHDLHCVGLLVRTWLVTKGYCVEKSQRDAATEFVDYVQNPEAKPSASGGLQHHWLRL